MRSVLALLLLAGCIKFDGGGQTPPPSDGVIDTGTDAMFDASFDATFDATIACPADFMTIPNGELGHKYRLFAGSDQWIDQHNVKCVTNGGYLAIPNSAAELAGLFDFASSGSTIALWVGVSDRQSEGQERDVLGNLYTALAVANNNVTDDCVLTANGTTLVYEDCSSVFPAVCECDEP